MIRPVSIFKQNNFIRNMKVNSKNISFKGDIPNDTVSFSFPSTSNRRKCLNYALEIAQLAQNSKSIKTAEIEKLARRYVPSLNMIDIKQLDYVLYKGASKNYNAYLLPEYNMDFSLKSLTSFVPKLIPGSENINQTISTYAHEMCHALQRQQDDTYAGLQQISLGNFEYARAINTLASYITSKFSASYTDSIILEDTINHYAHSDMTLKQAYLAANEAINSSELSKVINNSFDDIYAGMQDQIKSVPEFAAVLNFYGEHTLKEILKLQCARQVALEKEAYEVQLKILRTLGEDRISARVMIAPIANSLIYEALTQSYLQ